MGPESGIHETEAIDASVHSFVYVCIHDWPRLGPEFGCIWVWVEYNSVNYLALAQWADCPAQGAMKLNCREPGRELRLSSVNKKLRRNYINIKIEIALSLFKQKINYNQGNGFILQQNM